MKLQIRILFFCCLFSTQSIGAQEMEHLFSTQVTAKSQTREARNTAIRAAMLTVIQRFTLSDAFMDNLIVKRALDNAASYVDQYQNVQGQVELDKNSPRILRITFNQELLMTMLNRSGMAVWNEKRDKTLIWLVIEQGGREVFLEIGQNIEIEEALQEAVLTHGVPILMPLMDLEEKQQISVQDILVVNSETVLAVSARYGVATILAGKLVKRGSCWLSEWNLHLQKREERWTESCANVTTNISRALQHVYQQLVLFYALKIK